MNRNEIDYDLLFDILTVDSNVKKENEVHDSKPTENKTDDDFDMLHVSNSASLFRANKTGLTFKIFI